jgi:hypothetical protein
VMPLLRQWGVFEIEHLDEEGERAREELAAAVAALDTQATRFVEQREAAAAKRAARRAGWGGRPCGYRGPAGPFRTGSDESDTSRAQGRDG